MVSSFSIEELVDQDKVRRLRARKFLKVLKVILPSRCVLVSGSPVASLNILSLQLDRFIRPLRAFGAVSRADYFDAALMDDQALFDIGKITLFLFAG